MPEVHCMCAAVHKKGANLELIVLSAILGSDIGGSGHGK
jgi:hypothetical protein